MGSVRGMRVEMRAGYYPQWEKLPGRFFNARDISIRCEFTETNAADAEESHVSSLAGTELATVVDTSWELWLLSFCASIFKFSAFPLPAENKCITSHDSK